MIKSGGGAAPVDPFFEMIPDSEWNACVGSQGVEENYVDGYIEAAIELASAVIDKKLYASRDTLAMPILYNGRHALELSLKFAINKLHRVGALAAPHKPDHDILSHWAHLRDAKIGDTMIRTLVDELEPYVTSLSNIDNDGQELRYAKTQAGKKSLQTIALVNLPHIRKSLDEMAKTLTRLKRRVHEFTDECSTGTFTRECSRKDLRTIAEALGAHKTWTEENFVDRKIAICKRFDLGSKEFSQALDKIKESRELGVIVGLEQELHHLSDKKAFDVLRLWAKVNFLEKEDHEDLGLDFFNRDFDKVREHLRIRRELDDAVQAILTSNELADLEALFYIGRGPEYGESYDRVLQSTKASHGSTPAPDVHQILSKTSLLENVALGAQLVGRPSLAAKLRALRPNVDLDDAALS